MNYFRFFFASYLTNAILAVAATSFVGAVSHSTTIGLVVSALCCSLLAVGFGWWNGRSLSAGLSLIEQVVATGETAEGETAFHRSARRLQSHVQRWVDAAATGRQQMREVEEVLSTVDRRGTERGDRRSAARQLRLLLSSLGRETHEVLKQLVACNGEIDRLCQRLLQVSQHQNESSAKGLRDIELLSEEIGTIEKTTHRVQESFEALTSATIAVVENISECRTGVVRVREEMTTGETKIRLLHEHALEIGALMQTISELSARTDMLALNASIESVRAGEHGRGFAVVAEEIRKLSGLVANSSQEVIERIGSIESGIDDANRILARERADIDSETKRLSQIHRALTNVKDNTEQAKDQVLGRLFEITQLQRRSTQITSLVQQILDASDSHRVDAGEARWKTTTLTELITRVTDILEPLLIAAKQNGKNSIQDHSTVEHDALTNPLELVG